MITDFIPDEFKLYCFVSFSKHKYKVDTHGNRSVSFFFFLVTKDSNLRAQWLQKIRRDVGWKDLHFNRYYKGLFGVSFGKGK